MNPKIALKILQGQCQRWNGKQSKNFHFQFFLAYSPQFLLLQSKEVAFQVYADMQKELLPRYKSNRQNRKLKTTFGVDRGPLLPHYAPRFLKLWEPLDQIISEVSPGPKFHVVWFSGSRGEKWGEGDAEEIEEEEEALEE